jgi:N-acyl-L-homoserine lactone synthetase
MGNDKKKIHLRLKVRSSKDLADGELLAIFKKRFQVYNDTGLINTIKNLFELNPRLKKILFSNDDKVPDVIDLNDYRIDCDKYDFDESCMHVVVMKKDEVVAYMRLIHDTSKFGLPLEKIYSKEYNNFKLSNSDSKTIEISRLVVDRNYRISSLANLSGSNANLQLKVAHQLFKIMYLYVKKVGITDILIEVHPKHVPLYKYEYYFDVIGEEKLSPDVNNKPAVLLHHNVDKAWNDNNDGKSFANDIRDELSQKFLKPDSKELKELAFDYNIDLDFSMLKSLTDVYSLVFRVYKNKVKDMVNG